LTHRPQASATRGTVADAELALRRRLAGCRDAEERRHLTLELVVLYSYSGRQTLALQHLHRLLESTADPAEQADYLLGLGQLMEQVGDHGGASAFYREGLALPRAPAETRHLLHDNLGACLNRAGAFAAAEAHCRAAIALDAGRHDAHRNLGVALEGQERLVDAARAFIRAVQLEPRDPQALQHLERLVRSRPSLPEALSALASHVEECRALVRNARRAVSLTSRPKVAACD